MHVFFDMCILIFLFAQCGRRDVVSPSGELCLSSCDNRDKLSINSGNSYMMAQYCSYLTFENLYYYGDGNDDDKLCYTKKILR